MKARYYQLIATSLATCLTICQIPAWAQVQGQRPKILASESQVKKVQASSTNQSQNRMTQPVQRKAKTEMKITHFDLPGSGKVQAKVNGRSTTVEKKAYSVFDSDINSEANLLETEVIVEAATSQGLIFSAMGSHAESVVKNANNVETEERTGAKEPVFSVGYKIQNTESSLVFGMISYSPKIGPMEVNQSVDGKLESGSYEGRDEFGFGGGAATRTSNIIIGGSLMLYSAGEREVNVKIAANGNQPVTVTGTGGNRGRIEGFVEFPSQLTVGGLYRIDGYEDEQLFSKSSLETTLVEAFNVYTLAGYGSYEVSENFLLRGSLRYVRSNVGKEASVDGSGVDLGLRYQF